MSLEWTPSSDAEAEGAELVTNYAAVARTTDALNYAILLQNAEFNDLATANEASALLESDVVARQKLAVDGLARATSGMRAMDAYGNIGRWSLSTRFNLEAIELSHETPEEADKRKALVATTLGKSALNGRQARLQRRYDELAGSDLDLDAMYLQLTEWDIASDQLFGILGKPWVVPQAYTALREGPLQQTIERKRASKDQAIMSVDYLTKAILQYAIDGQPFTMAELRAHAPMIAALNDEEYRAFKTSFKSRLSMTWFVFESSGDSQAEWIVTGKTSSQTYQLNSSITSYDELVDGRGDPLYLNASPETQTELLTRSIVATIANVVASSQQQRNPTLKSLVATIRKKENMSADDVAGFIDQLVRDGKLQLTAAPKDQLRVYVTKRSPKNRS